MDTARLQPGDVLGRFTILSKIGQGGMAVVYKARQEDLDRICALKVISAGAVSPDFLKRFDTEAKNLALLSHPNIVQIYDVGTEEDIRFIAMEYIEGKPLSEWIGGSRIDARWACDITAQVAEGLEYAHRKGVIHRDVKPHNIMIREDGHPVIMDFGLSKITADVEGTLTKTGQVMGTAKYMSPEQADAAPVDARTDIFSLGIILYELLTFSHPFADRESVQQTVVNILTREPVPPRKLIPRTPRDAGTITMKALEKDRVRRYPSALEMAADLRRFLNDEPILARPVTVITRLGRKAKKHRLLLGIAASVILLLGMVSVGYFHLARQKIARLRTITIVHLAGDVSVFDVANNRLIRAEVGMTLGADHIVQTGPRSTATITIGENIKAIDEKTKVEFSFAREKRKSVVLVRTFFGSVFSNFTGFNPTVNQIRIITPSFTASPPQHSSFDITVDEGSGESQLKVLKGDVVLKSDRTREEVVVKRGKKILVVGKTGEYHLDELSGQDLTGVRTRIGDKLFAAALNGPGSEQKAGASSNRKPLFISVPVKDAYVEEEYVYTPRVNDEDGDHLIFELVAGPDSMRLAPFSGKISWIPVQEGEHTVTLKAADGCGGAAVQRFDLTVSRDLPPVARLAAAPVPGTGRMTFRLDASGTFDEETGRLEFRWDFNGDGTWDFPEGGMFGKDRMVEYTYPAAKTYQVILEVRDVRGHTTRTVQALAAGISCFADAGNDTSLGLGGTACLRGTGFCKIGSITKYVWDFDGDGSDDLVLDRVKTVRQRFAEGLHTAVLRIETTYGDSARDSVRITVKDIPVKITLGAERVGANVGSRVSLRAAAEDPDGAITRYEWDFDGDGSYDWQSRSGGTAVTRYHAAGVYKARLRVTDSRGKQFTAGLEVSVQ